MDKSVDILVFLLSGFFAVAGLLATNDVFTTELAKNTYFLGLVANNLDFIKALTNNGTFRSDIKLIVKETGGSGGVTN